MTYDVHSPPHPSHSCHCEHTYVNRAARATHTHISENSHLHIQDAQLHKHKTNMATVTAQKYNVCA